MTGFLVNGSFHSFILSHFSKDTLKKLIQHVDNHQQYFGAYQACITWFESANQKLTHCADASGDKDVIQSRLDNLHVRLYYRKCVKDCLMKHRENIFELAKIV